LQIVAPGGSYRKAILALKAGADAVYVASHQYGLRKSADNLDEDELRWLVTFAHEQGKKVYITMNIMAHVEDAVGLPVYLEMLEAIGPDALIIADMGVARLANRYCTIPIHVSTQASVTNWRTAKLWKEMVGAKRVVVARELSLDECQEIKEKAEIEVETFIHGAMCVSYSGKCVISNYTAGRDSNRGGCIQSCRHNYQNLTDNKDSYIMNAKDLNGLELIPQFLNAGIDAVKIEGRMKSEAYLINTVSMYKKAIPSNKPFCLPLTKGKVPAGRMGSLEQGTSKGEVSRRDGGGLDAGGLQGVLKQQKYPISFSNRGYSQGSLLTPASPDTLSTAWNGYQMSHDYVGTVREVDEQWAYVHVKAPFSCSESLSRLSITGEVEAITPTAIESLAGDKLERTQPNMVVKIKAPLELDDLVIKAHA